MFDSWYLISSILIIDSCSWALCSCKNLLCDPSQEIIKFYKPIGLLSEPTRGWRSLGDLTLDDAKVNEEVYLVAEDCRYKAMLGKWTMASRSIRLCVKREHTFWCLTPKAWCSPCFDLALALVLLLFINLFISVPSIWIVDQEGSSSILNLSISE